jgi:transcriptional regulator with XRE-family HTH domain
MSNKNIKAKNVAHTFLTENLVKNFNIFFKKAGLTQVELAKVSNIPESTIHGVRTGAYANPRLNTLFNIAAFFKINISKLIGELPLNFQEAAIPILEWHNLDIQNSKIDININDDTRFISSDLQSKNPLFALKTDLKQGNLEGQNDIILVEYTEEFYNNNLAILSINKSAPVIKKLIKEGQSIYTESIFANIPIEKLDLNKTKIFGIIKETRHKL